MEGLAELRVKESDRLAATAAGLAACGVAARVEGDDLIVEGRGEVEAAASSRPIWTTASPWRSSSLGLARREPVTVDDSSHDRDELPRFRASDDQARRVSFDEQACMIIAIDGPAASGKGTLGKRIAAHYGLAHLDTGKLYRAVARDTLATERRSLRRRAPRSPRRKALDPETLGRSRP